MGKAIPPPPGLVALGAQVRVPLLVRKLKQLQTPPQGGTEEAEGRLQRSHGHTGAPSSRGGLKTPRGFYLLPTRDPTE